MQIFVKYVAQSEAFFKVFLIFRSRDKNSRLAMIVTWTLNGFL